MDARGRRMCSCLPMTPLPPWQGHGAFVVIDRCAMPAAGMSPRVRCAHCLPIPLIWLLLWQVEEIVAFHLVSSVRTCMNQIPKLTLYISCIGQLPSPGLSINLSSNNPFRNRAASPASLDAAFATSTNSPFDDPTPIQRPVSRNPFLDQSHQPLKSLGGISNKSEHKSLSAEDIFVCLRDHAQSRRRQHGNGHHANPHETDRVTRAGSTYWLTNVSRIH